MRFELSFPESVRSEPVDGRVYVVVTRKASPSRDCSSARPAASTRRLRSSARTWRDFAPGAAAVIDDRANGYPLERLSALPAGDYFVQGVLNVYTTFHRADGHTVRLHMDQWEGQDFPISPGNLYSEPRRVHLDPAAPQTIRLVLDRKIPPIAVPPDTEWVKHVRFQSPSLSKFWGQPIWIGATILLPKDYDRDTSVSYPVNYEQGHFSARRAGRIRRPYRARPERDPSARRSASGGWTSSRRTGRPARRRRCSSSRSSIRRPTTTTPTRSTRRTWARTARRSPRS